MVRGLGRTTKYLIIACVFLFTVNILLGLILIRQSDAAIRTLIENRMLDVSNTAAAMLDGDMLESLDEEHKDASEYQSVLKTLSYFQDNIDLEYIYCIRDLGNGNFIFTIDPSDEPGEFGEHIASTEALYQASLGTASVDKAPYEDRWGRFYSAYTPVYDSEQKITGIVAVDFSAAWYEQQIFNLMSTTLLITGFSLFLAIVVIVFVAARFRKRFHLMLGEMNAVSEGIETLVHEISPRIKINVHNEADKPDSGDDIAELSNKIRSLEDQLSRQIAYVRSQAFVDGLTGLENRTAYEDHVKQLDDDIKEGKAAFAVALFDINGLKEINDLYGHDRGDLSISQVANALKQTFGDMKLYRIGGDEFVSILENKYSDVKSRFDHLDKILEEANAAAVARGYAVYKPDMDNGYRAVFNRADSAMYENKQHYYLTHKEKNRRSSL